MSSSTRLDEQALRRPEFTEGVAITLSDGQAWTFPVPAFGDFYPRRGPDGRTRRSWPRWPTSPSTCSPGITRSGRTR
jgi:hypothetical protein